MEKNILKKYFMIAAAILLQIQSTFLRAETWVNLPYPNDIKDHIKDENKKIDLDDDPLYLGSFNELFDSAKTDSIIAAAFITKDTHGELSVSYVNPLSYLDDFFKNVPNNPQAIITKKAYNDLKRTYKQEDANYRTGQHTFKNYILKEDERFTTVVEDDRDPWHRKPPFFVDPFKGSLIENIYFFKITRTKKEDGLYDYKAEYIGNLDDIVGNTPDIINWGPTKIANLQLELINNFEGDTTAKASEFKKIIKKYKDAYEDSIANALTDLLPENRNVSPEEKKKRQREKALDDILQHLGQGIRQLLNITKVFDQQIKPFGIKIPLKDFQNIIEEKKESFGLEVNYIFDIIHDYAPLIEEYDLNKEDTIEALNTQFVKILYELYPKLSSLLKFNLIRNLKKIKTNNEALQSVITGIIDDYEQKENEDKFVKIITKIITQPHSAQQLVATFDREIKPLNVKINLNTFQRIIKNHAKVLAFNSQLFWQFINDNLPLIREYANKKEETTQALYAEFIRALQDLSPQVLPDSKAEFIANLKKVVTTNSEIKMAIAAIINDYTKEQEREKAERAGKILVKLSSIKDAQRGRVAEKYFEETSKLDLSHQELQTALNNVIEVHINKDNDPYAAFTFFKIHGSYQDQQDLNRAINNIVTMAKQRLLSLAPQEEYAFIASFKKIGDDNRLFKDIIATAIKNAPQERAASAKALVNFAQALSSI